jgi:hypothetical protein
MQVRGVLALTAIVALAVWAPAVTLRAAQAQGAAQQTPQQRDIESLVRLVDGVGLGEQAPPAGVSVRWQSNHFIKGQGSDTYIPFTLSINRSQLQRSSVALYVRVVERQQPVAPKPGEPRPKYAWDNLQFVEVPADGMVSRAIAVPPGEYNVFVAVKEAATEQDAATERLGVLRRELTVPDYATSGLVTSSIILARDMEVLSAPLPPERQAEQPYVLGPMRIVPAGTSSFSTSGSLQIVFWIYGARAAAGGKPDVEVEYLFHRQTAEGLTYFNRTDPNVLNADTLPPEFSLAAGHQLLESIVVPLEAFPAGDYRLEIKVNDKVSGEAITRTVNFTVLAA